MYAPMCTSDYGKTILVIFLCGSLYNTDVKVMRLLPPTFCLVSSYGQNPIVGLSALASDLFLTIFILSWFEFLFGFAIILIMIAETSDKPAPHARSRGTPNAMFFKIGAIGSLVSSITVPLAVYLSLSWATSLIDPVTLLLFFVTAISLVMQSVGVYGFYHNYNEVSGLVAALIGVIVAVLFALFPVLLLTPMAPSILLVYPSLYILLFMEDHIWSFLFYRVTRLTASQKYSGASLTVSLFILASGFFLFFPYAIAAYVFYMSPARFVYE